MKHLTIILSFCMACHAHAQKLVPDSKPDELPDTLLGVEPVIAPPAVEPLTGADEPPVVSHGERPDVQQTPDEGISIQVEKPNIAPGAVPPTGEVKIYSPWPAKPMFPAPEGWKFAPAPEALAPYRTKATLSTGQEVSLAITPFVLVPITDGQTSIRISEPGYQPELGYVQRDTIGVMLQKSNADLEQNEQQAAESIRRLQQLLSSLPKTNAAAPPAAPAAPVAPKQAKP